LNPKILIIDDDENICNIARIALEAQDFQVESVMEGEKGLEKLLNEDFHLLILDIMLPEKDGLEICKEIRNSPKSSIPIIMLTAKTEEVDRILGLELGADDYLTKPFSPRELTARVKAILRRSETYQPTKRVYQKGNLKIEPESYKIHVNHKELPLTPKEFELLLLLIQQQSKAFTRKEILQKIWGYDLPVDSTRTVDEHIKRLRNKINHADKTYSYIQTVRGVGYKFEVIEK